MTKRYPGIQRAPGVTMPDGEAGHDLLKRLSRVSKDIGHPIRIISGKRKAYDQWVLYMRYLRGNGNLAAPCCWKHYQHSWNSCGKACASMHCRSRAVDCGVVDAHGNYRSIGLSDNARKAMRKHGLCLPVGNGEVWHVQVGNSWVS